MDVKWTLLRESSSNDDSAKDGLSLEITGGFNKVDGKKKPQKAIVEFLCDRKRDGLENLLDPEDKYESPKAKTKREEDGDKKDDDKKDDEKKDDGKKDDDKKDEGSEDDAESASLQFVRYDQGNTEYDVLRLQWRTKYACEDQTDVDDGETTAGWGFFTWFILIAFLSTATYLIFGSWLNYNRYGARGWDLLPHGDTIRDVPYLLKDWIRRVTSSLQGGGSRGGYAAV